MGMLGLIQPAVFGFFFGPLIALVLLYNMTSERRRGALRFEKILGTSLALFYSALLVMIGVFFLYFAAMHGHLFFNFMAVLLAWFWLGILNMSMSALLTMELWKFPVFLFVFPIWWFAFWFPVHMLVNNELSKREKLWWICSHLLLTALLVPVTTSIYAVRYPFRVRSSFSQENYDSEEGTRLEQKDVHIDRPAQTSTRHVPIETVEEGTHQTTIDLVERKETAG